MTIISVGVIVVDDEGRKRISRNHPSFDRFIPNDWEKTKIHKLRNYTTRTFVNVTLRIGIIIPIIPAKLTTH